MQLIESKFLSKSFLRYVFPSEKEKKKKKKTKGGFNNKDICDFYFLLI